MTIALYSAVTTSARSQGALSAVGDGVQIGAEMIDILLADDGRVHAVRIDGGGDLTGCSRTAVHPSLT